LILDRFYSQWDQPTSIFADGTRFVTTVQIRIEPDGTISSARIVRGSGNVVMDQSVEAALARVQRIEALPPGLAGAGAYTVNIAFELE
ncbi:MAG: TonB C-terminal domain-containing protein, partial [Terrimicrobiaceae bacterium]|nr:TonB C-terminal domain-containing protein [Terrimicrobiaceae bacterium]